MYGNKEKSNARFSIWRSGRPARKRGRDDALIHAPLTMQPADTDEYPSVFLALLMNRHLGGSCCTDNFFAVAHDDVSGGGRPVPTLPSLEGNESSIIQCRSSLGSTALLEVT